MIAGREEKPARASFLLHAGGLAYHASPSQGELRRLFFSITKLDPLSLFLSATPRMKSNRP